MLSISKPRKGGSGKGYYFRYYTRDALQPGFWFGRGADLLDLPVEVSRTHFNNLLEGFSPDGRKPLVQNAGDEDRRGFWDLTLSVPKCLSVLYAVSPEMRGEIRQAAETTVRATLMEVEDSLGMSRMLKAGKLILPASLVFAVFHHDTSREQDPQLHWHCVLVNTAMRIDGTTGAVHTKPIYEEKMNIGRLFREKLAAEITQRFGLEITMEKDTFQIEGVSQELCDAFSKRSKQIRDYMKRHDLRGAVAASRAVIKTRGPKKYTDREKLFQKWSEIAKEHGLGPEKIEAIWKRGQERLKGQTFEAFEHERAQAKRGESSERSQSKSRSKSQSKGQRQSDAEQKRRSGFGRKACGRKSWGEAWKQWRAFRKFERELREARDRIFVENQTRPRLMRIGFALAYKHNVDRKLVEEAVDKLKLPFHHRFYRIEWDPLFPKGSWFLKNLKVPKVVLWNKARRWGRVTNRLKLPTLGSKTPSIALQRRNLFANSPIPRLRNFSLPAIRLRNEKLPTQPLVESRKRKMRH